MKETSMYHVILEAEPTKDSAEYATASSATVDIFVLADTMIEAITRTSDYVMSRAWVVTQESSCAVVTHDRLRAMDETSLALLRRAQREGMHALFVGSRRQESEGSDTLVYPLRDRDRSDPTEH